MCNVYEMLFIHCLRKCNMVNMGGIVDISYEGVKTAGFYNLQSHIYVSSSCWYHMQVLNYRCHILSNMHNTDIPYDNLTKSSEM